MAAIGVEGKAGVIPEYGAVPQREPVDYCPLGYEREWTTSAPTDRGS